MSESPSNTPSNSPVIECKPSKWFKVRAVLILLMLGFFAAWFFKDGYAGYREKNLEYVSKQLFTDKTESQDDYVVNASELFESKEYTPETWAEFAKEQVVSVPKEERGLLPRDYDYSTKWPQELVDGYDELKEGRADKIWAKYSGRMKWSIDVSDKIYDEGKIREQFIVCGVCLLLLLIAAFICIRTMGRKMSVTDSAYFSADGKEVAFTSMTKIDKRKWDTKGLALIYYDDEGTTKKVKVDGMVYGHFKEEDGKPAEALFSHILENFKGELIEYVIDDEEEEDETSNEASGEKSEEKSEE